jgi:N-acetylmuramoyl-L-alanine amidase
LFPVVHLPVQSTVGDKSFVVVIDPGHGGKDYGAIGSASNEKSINLAVSLLVGDYIKKAYPDVTVMYTRKTDVFIELDQRSEIANKAKADLFISIHTNANRSKTPYGTETYTLGLARSDENLEVAKRENAVILLEDDYERKYEGFDPNSSESYIIFEFMQNKFVEQSIFLASKIQSEFTNSSKRHNRGVKQAGFLVLRTTGMPSVLIELGFISNKAEEKYLSSKAGQQQLAKSIVKAFGQYKADYDRKSGMSAQEQVPTADNDSAVTSTRSGNETSGQVIYKVQILSANKKLSTNAPELKGYKADYYVEKGLYKYTFGESSDFDEIVKIRKSLIKDFKDAFIIQFKDGVKIINK